MSEADWKVIYVVIDSTQPSYPPVAAFDSDAAAVGWRDEFDKYAWVVPVPLNPPESFAWRLRQEEEGR